MARRKKRKPQKLGILGVLIAIALIIFEFCGTDITNYFSSLNFSISNSDTEGETTETINGDTIVTEVSGDLKVYFIDVGQADSILIQNNGENMLIDAGNNADGSKLVTYFESLGITEFKYVVGTHPHEDHIGGLDDVINAFDIDKVYLPDAITTTTTFESVLDAIDAKNMTYTVPEIGEIFTLGSSSFKVLYTGTDTSDLNNASIVLKMTFGSTSFLFTGDVTSTVEDQLLTNDISVDVLKVGHHGSQYSSSTSFLDKVNPKYAIISVGKNNSYGHPAETTLNNLKSRNISVYRTDELGTILVTSDGTTLSVEYFETDTNG